MVVERVCRVIQCGRCSGAGYILRPPHYCIPMPPPSKEECPECKGKKVVALVASGVTVVRDSSFKYLPSID